MCVDVAIFFCCLCGKKIGKGECCEISDKGINQEEYMFICQFFLLLIR